METEDSFRNKGFLLFLYIISMKTVEQFSPFTLEEASLGNEEDAHCGRNTALEIYGFMLNVVFNKLCCTLSAQGDLAYLIAAKEKSDKMNYTKICLVRFTLSFETVVCDLFNALSLYIYIYIVRLCSVYYCKMKSEN